MRRFFLFASTLLLFTTNAASAQDSQPESYCGLSTADTKSFFAFDKELRTAITKQDAAAMALLVHYPLRINDNGGKYYIDDAAALQSHFQELFPAIIRNAVLNEKVSNVPCTKEGIAYGNGDVWVTLTKLGFEIMVINLPDTRYLLPRRISVRMEFICRTEKLQIVIDSDIAGVPHYRAWNRPHTISDNPDLEISIGNKEIEGTDGCAHAVWTFKRGTTIYTVEELGCFPDSNQPPEGARGMLEVKVADKPEASSWCF
jgi:hypothetical protein